MKKSEVDEIVLVGWSTHALMLKTLKHAVLPSAACIQGMEDANMKKIEIDEIVLVGGSTHAVLLTQTTKHAVVSAICCMFSGHGGRQHEEERDR
jgi:hypothetical protein